MEACRQGTIVANWSGAVILLHEGQDLSLVMHHQHTRSRAFIALGACPSLIAPSALVCTQKYAISSSAARTSTPCGCVCSPRAPLRQCHPPMRFGRPSRLIVSLVLIS